MQSNEHRRCLRGVLSTSRVSMIVAIAGWFVMMDAYHFKMPGQRRRRRMRTSSHPQTSDAPPPENATTSGQADTDHLDVDGPTGTALLNDGTSQFTHLVVRQRHLAGEGLYAIPGARPDYTLLQSLGVGGVGEVRLAWQGSLDRTVAIKRLHSQSAADGDSLLQEAVVTGGLDHPNIIPVHDVGYDDTGTPFYVMRQMEGSSWAFSIGRLSLDENLEILQRLCDAVAYAHSRGVIHRDLKPGNVMIGDHNQVLLMDWGFAVALPGFEASQAEHLERTCTISGTPAYMAPEMARGEGLLITPRSDIYLLGAILFEILTGNPPHEGETHEETVANAAANRLRHHRHRGELMEVALKAMATDTHDRFFSAHDFQNALRTFARHGDSRSLHRRASLTLDRAAVTGEDAFFLRAIIALEESLALWPGNDEARRDLSRARRLRATFALLRGDRPLAAAMLDPDDPDHAALRNRMATQDGSGPRPAVIDESTRLWLPICDETFGDDSWTKRWDVLAGRARRVHQCLEARAGTPLLIVYRLPVAGDVRLSFDCTITSAYLSDLSCFLGARLTPDPQEIYRTGWELKYGGYDNTAICCYHAGRQLLAEEATVLERDRPYHVMVERLGDRVRLEVDGREVFTLADRHRHPGPGNDRLGLFGWGATYRYSNLRIEVPVTIDAIPLHELAATHLDLGHYRTAERVCTRLVGQSADTDETVRVLHRQARTLAATETDLPEHRRRITARWPQARVELRESGLAVDLTACGVGDLAPLTGMPIASLAIGHNPVTDLEPLHDMPLRFLDCSACPITDLAPLAGSGLHHLRAPQCRIKDLAPLARIPLQRLNLNYNRIDDIAPLAGSSIQRLRLAGNWIRDLAPLAGHRFQLLELADNDIEDLSPLVATRVRILLVPGNRIQDVGPAAALRPEVIDVAGNLLTDLAPLAALDLRELDCTDNLLPALDRLADHPPQRFRFADNDLPDSLLGELALNYSYNPSYHHLARQARIELAVRRDDVRSLRAEAIAVHDRRWCLLGYRLRHRAALALCGRFDGHPVCPHTRSMDNTLTSLIPGTLPVWLGLHADGDRWDDGRPLTYCGLAPWHRDRDHQPVIRRDGRWLPAPANDSRAYVVIQWPD